MLISNEIEGACFNPTHLAGFDSGAIRALDGHGWRTRLICRPRHVALLNFAQLAAAGLLHLLAFTHDAYAGGYSACRSVTLSPIAVEFTAEGAQVSGFDDVRRSRELAKYMSDKVVRYPALRNYMTDMTDLVGDFIGHDFLFGFRSSQCETACPGFLITKAGWKEGNLAHYYWKYLEKLDNITTGGSIFMVDGQIYTTSFRTDASGRTTSSSIMSAMPDKERGFLTACLEGNGR